MFNENHFQNLTNHQKKEVAIEQEPIIKELVEKINELQERAESFIGEGATAKVVASKTNPAICYKIIHSSGEYNFRNLVDSEADLLEKAGQVGKTCGVKVPDPYYSILTKDQDAFEVLVMERLNATSIKDLIEQDLEVASDFNFKEFVARIEIFFEKLHEQNIFHRDAHWGNIMIENETNLPCIIDFGASTEITLRSEDPYKQINFNNDTVTFTSDEHRIREELRVKLRTFLFKKYGNIHNL